MIAEVLCQAWKKWTLHVAGAERRLPGLLDKHVRTTCHFSVTHTQRARREQILFLHNRMSIRRELVFKTVVLTENRRVRVMRGNEFDPKISHLLEDVC